MNVYVLFETYEMQPRTFASETAARKALDELLDDYRTNGWEVIEDTPGRDYEVKCEEEGRYQVFLDNTWMEIEEK